MENFREILARVYFGNTLQNYCWLAGIIVAGFLFQRYLSKLLSNFLYRFIHKYAEGLDRENFFILLKKPLSWLIMLLIIYSASSQIDFPEDWKLAPENEFGLRMVMHRVYQLFLVGSVTWVLQRMTDFAGLILLKKAQKTESRHDDQLVPFIVEMAKIVVMILAVLFSLGAIFNINVGSLVAGLGIGGLALALAAKESLENLLSSFVIFFDKPFTVGDLVSVGTVTGTVERVGFRSTRLRTPEKSFVTVPNRKMIDAELDNLTLRTSRRARFNVGLTYATSIEQLKKIVAEIQTILNENPLINKDAKVSFYEFGGSSLNITMEYFVDTMDWLVYLKIREEINYKIMKIVRSNGSDFAIPSMTVYHSDADRTFPTEQKGASDR